MEIRSQVLIYFSKSPIRWGLAELKQGTLLRSSMWVARTESPEPSPTPSWGVRYQDAGIRGRAKTCTYAL